MHLQTFLLTFEFLLIFFIILGICGTYAYSFLIYSITPKTKSNGSLRLPKPCSLVIPVHQCAKPLTKKLELLDINSPAFMHEVIVVCDGDVENLDVLNKFPSVRIITLSRAGKNAALNHAIQTALHKIVVITDKDALFPCSSLHALLQAFSNPNIGGACGSLSITNDNQMGQQSHWTLERKIKFYESVALGNLTAATGSMLAIRKDTWEPIPVGMADDLYIALSCKARGKQFIFVPEATCFTPPRSKCMHTSYHRQKRITAQSFATLWKFKPLLLPRYGHYAFLLIMHKVLRRFVPLMFLLLTTTALLLAPNSIYQSIIAVGCIAALLAGGFACWHSSTSSSLHPFLKKISWMVAIQAGIVTGFLNWLCKKNNCMWE